MEDAGDFEFSTWPFLNATRFDLILVGNGLHNQNHDLAWSSFYAAAMFARLGRAYPGSTVVNVGVWANDASQRKQGFSWAASLWKNHALSHAFATAAASQGIASLQLLAMTLPVRSMTTDGVHLTWPHPLASVAAMVWHDVLFLLRRRESTSVQATKDRLLRLPVREAVAPAEGRGEAELTGAEAAHRASRRDRRVRQWKALFLLLILLPLPLVGAWSAHRPC